MVINQSGFIGPSISNYHIMIIGICAYLSKNYFMLLEMTRHEIRYTSFSVY